MYKSYKKLRFGIVAAILLGFFGFSANAQVKIGLPASTANSSSILDVSNTGDGTKGLLLPMVALTGTDMAAPLPAHVAGMMVYNTATAGVGATAVVPGIYVNDGTKWQQLVGSTSGTATYTNSTINCGGTLSGTYQMGVPTTSSNTKNITITVASAGAYSASTNTQNGVSFSASGSLLNTGPGIAITLTASGTPTASGIFTYTVSLGGQTCTFNVTYAGNATFGCSNTSQTQSPAGLLNNGTAYTGTYTIPYTAGNGAAYSASSVTVSGLTLSHAAGNYAVGSGNIVYTLSGTYTGSSNNSVSFTIPECSTVPNFGDAIRAALAAGGCASCAAYDAASVNQWVSVSASEYNQLGNFMTLNTAGDNDADIANNLSVWASFGNGTANPSSTESITGPTYAQVPANNYVIAFAAIVGQQNSSVGAHLKYANGSVFGSYFNDNGNLSVPGTTPAGNMMYNVKKRPSSVISGSAAECGFYHGNNAFIGTYNNGGSSYSNYFSSGDGSSVAFVDHRVFFYQARCTATKKW